MGHDIAEVLQAGKPKEEFRNYENAPGRQETVTAFYREQHEKQTVEFNKQIRADFHKSERIRMGVWEMLQYLDGVVDDSDPDTDCSQMTHALQTAESLRRLYPGEKYDWLHLTGLIHDLGKVQSVTDPERNLVGLEQWAVTGDTFPVGCAFSDLCVLPQFFAENPDCKDDRYNSKLGIYVENCGLDKVMMSWGHDEYMYQVLKRSESLLPPEGLFIIRYHSFYPWHTKGAYTHLVNDSDTENLEWIKRFNSHDLYSKAHDMPDMNTLETYYKGLIEKYFPKELKW